MTIAADETMRARETNDVCTIFKEVTGISVDREREKTVIGYWLDRNWTLHDFRLLMEYHVNSPHERTFLDKPGNMNLRMMFNPARADRLSDILLQLRHSSLKKGVFETSPKMTPLMLMKCGAKILLGNKTDYDNHVSDCFANQGACFFFPKDILQT